MYLSTRILLTFFSRRGIEEGTDEWMYFCGWMVLSIWTWVRIDPSIDGTKSIFVLDGFSIIRKITEKGYGLGFICLKEKWRYLN